MQKQIILLTILLHSSFSFSSPAPVKTIDITKLAASDSLLKNAMFNTILNYLANKAREDEKAANRELLSILSKNLETEIAA